MRTKFLQFTAKLGTPGMDITFRRPPVISIAPGECTISPEIEQTAQHRDRLKGSDLTTIGVGMLGFGFIGKVHSHAHRSLPLFYDPLPLETKLIGVCTTSVASSEKAIRQAGFQFSTQSAQELIYHPEIDLIHICTPNDMHKDAVLAAILAGKHIYCDKPLGLDVSEAEEICQAARSSSAVHQMTFNYRFVPAIMRAKQLIESGFLGDLFQFRLAYLHAGYIDPARPYSWRTNMQKSGGGAIADLGAHVIDLTRFLTANESSLPRGGEIAEVQARFDTVIKSRKDPKTLELRAVDVDDIAIVQCRLAGGAIGTIEATRLATGVQDELRIELHGTKGALRFNLMDPNWLDAYDATLTEAALGGDRGFRRIECVTRYPAPYSLGATKNTVGWLNFHIQSLFDCVNNIALQRDGEPLSTNSPTFEDGLATQRVIDACTVSANSDSSRVNV